ncbi:MAG: hypothetical protein LBK47_09595 [Prevotellaceae bacterium]|jgi:hypothetical protein|nr:hypothetical protein [Prevotellaceae bacterium]
MRFLLFTTVAVLLVHSANGQAQTCTCENNFEWVKNTFEENDAGFQHTINKKGQAAYDIHNQLMVEKVKSAKTTMECIELLHEWLHFFRSGHITIEPSQNVLQTIPKADMYEVNIPEFEQRISTKQVIDYEGIWEFEDDKIGIQKNGANYIGFIIKPDAEVRRQIKLKIEQKNGKWQTTFFWPNHKPTVSGRSELIGKNHLQIGGLILKRVHPFFGENDLSVENYLKSFDPPSPYLEELSSTTLYLRLPSFEPDQKAAIDSVLTVNKDKILKTENLIIDIRNGTGGSDDTYAELLPFLYTNPIRTVGIEFLSTALNNQRFMDFATNPEYQDFFDEETRQLFKTYYDTMQSKLGEFVNLFGEDVYITQYDTIYEYPKNVGVIINQRNVSADEQLLLMAKQSKKVKLFGATTFGALDISNMYSVDSPCEEFKLWYCLSRSLRIPDMPIDGIGLQPDYYLDKTIPQHKWVEFVNEMLNK